MIFTTPSHTTQANAAQLHCLQRSEQIGERETLAYILWKLDSENNTGKFQNS